METPYCSCKPTRVWRQPAYGAAERMMAVADLAYLLAIDEPKRKAIEAERAAVRRQKHQISLSAWVLLCGVVLLI